MENINFSFPPMPVGADRAVIKPSQNFTKYVYRSIGAIVLFVITYFFLLLGAIAIAIAFGILGYGILVAHIGFVSLVAGFGLGFSGIMLVFFVIKFLFKSNRTNYSGMIEITENEQPKLFAFIYRLTAETQSPRPKKIFISADVNAGVFYNSSFWSMFFPVKKNLKIGLGLVNAVNVSEFKAIMAHEFGHFSQKSMKFGSYFYNFNKVIYDMLFENDGYDKILNSWARTHAILRLIALLNIKIVKGMQAILKQVYVVVNKTYLALSREMEFHADAVAAYVSGSNQMINSLKRIEIADLCYNNLLDFWNYKLEQNKRSPNLYPQHTAVLKFYAERRNFQLDTIGLPVIKEELSTTGNNQIIIEDQWSSHPSNNDRVLYLENINLNTPAINEPAWVLFEKQEELQSQLTSLLYTEANRNVTQVVDLEEFKTDFYNTINTHLFNDRYKDYFDEKGIAEFDIEEAIQLSAGINPLTFEELINEENCDLPILAKRLKQDIALLDEVINNPKNIKTFDYKGIKYVSNDAVSVQSEIKAAYDDAVKKMADLDKNLFIYFFKSAKSHDYRELLLNRYKTFFKYQSITATDFILYNEIMTAMRPLYNKMQPGQIRKTLEVVYEKEEALKPRLKELIQDNNLKPFLTDEQLKDLTIYLKTNWVYYLNPSYDNNAISIFRKAMDVYFSCTSKAIYEIKKDLLDFQFTVIEN